MYAIIGVAMVVGALGGYLAFGKLATRQRIGASIMVGAVCAIPAYYLASYLGAIPSTSCTKNSDCPEGEKCVDGVCTAPTGCTSNSDCSGSTPKCHSGQCVECITDKDCKNGTCQDYKCVCSKKGGACTETGDCCDGLICGSDNTCTDCVATGDPCTEQNCCDKHATCDPNLQKCCIGWTSASKYIPTCKSSSECCINQDCYVNLQRKAGVCLYDGNQSGYMSTLTPYTFQTTGGSYSLGPLGTISSSAQIPIGTTTGQASSLVFVPETGLSIAGPGESWPMWDGLTETINSQPTLYYIYDLTTSQWLMSNGSGNGAYISTVGEESEFDPWNIPSEASRFGITAESTDSVVDSGYEYVYINQSPENVLKLLKGEYELNGAYQNCCSSGTSSVTMDNYLISGSCNDIGASTCPGASDPSSVQWYATPATSSLNSSSYK